MRKHPSISLSSRVLERAKCFPKFALKTRTRGQPAIRSWPVLMVGYLVFWLISVSPATCMASMYSIFNGIWVIYSSPPSGAKDFSCEFWPPGARIKIQANGPSRLAIEENRHEWGGTIELLPPFPEGICSTYFSKDALFGEVDEVYTPRICKDKKLISLAHGFSYDVKFVLTQWSRIPKSEDKDLDDWFFIEQGAKQKSRFFEFYVPFTQPHWKLWIRNKNELIGSYTATLPSGKEETFVQIWRRESAKIDRPSNKN